jgi:hypothetical protein
MQEDDDKFVWQYIKHSCLIIHDEIEDVKYDIDELEPYYKLEVLSLLMCKKICYGYDDMNKKQKEKFNKKFDEIFSQLIDKAEDIAKYKNEQEYLKEVEKISYNYKFYKEIKQDNVFTYFKNELNKSIINLPKNIKLKNYILNMVIPRNIYE